VRLTSVPVGAFARSVAVAVLVLPAAACTGSPRHIGVDPSTSPATSVSTVAVTAQRRGHAEQVAATLLNRAVLPPGARLYRGVVPKHLASPFSQPRLMNLVVRSRLWVVPEPPSAVVAFLRSHTIFGLRMDSALGMSSQDGRVVVWNLSGKPTSSFGADLADVELQESVAAKPGGSFVRVDALAVWLNPRETDEYVPASDHVVTISRRVTIGAAAQRSARRLVVTDPRPVVRLAKIFDGLPVAIVGFRGCVADFGVVYTIAYSTTVSARPDVVVTAGACLSKVVVRDRNAAGLQTYALAEAAARLLDIKGYIFRP
jgi:hypothetical protein